MASVVYQERPSYFIVDGFRLPGIYKPQAFLDTLNFKAQRDDTIIATFPRSGTFWTHQILHLLRNKGKPSETYQEFMEGCPMIEMNGPISVEVQNPPRFYRSHLPYSMIPNSPDAKYIWVVRNPKDCLISLYHLTASGICNYVDGDFDEFFDDFIEGRVSYNDIFNHFMSWYEHRNDPNVLQIYYENMKADLKGTIMQIAKFLGPMYEETVKNEHQMSKILHHSSFTFMEKNINDLFNEDRGRSLGVGVASRPMTREIQNAFDPSTSIELPKVVRQGKVGSWKERFSEEQNRAFNEKIEERLKGTELLEFWKSNNYL